MSSVLELYPDLSFAYKLLFLISQIMVRIGDGLKLNHPGMEIATSIRWWMEQFRIWRTERRTPSSISIQPNWPLEQDQCNAIPYCCFNPIDSKNFLSRFKTNSLLVSDEEAQNLLGKPDADADSIPSCYYNVFFVFYDQFRKRFKCFLTVF